MTADTVDLVTIDDDSSEEASVIGTPANGIRNPNPSNGLRASNGVLPSPSPSSSTIRVSITNEKPLDLSALLATAPGGSGLEGAGLRSGSGPANPPVGRPMQRAPGNVTSGLKLTTTTPSGPLTAVAPISSALLRAANLKPNANPQLTPLPYKSVHNASTRFLDARKRYSTGAAHPAMVNGYKKPRMSSSKRMSVNVNDTYLVVEPESYSNEYDEFTGQFRCTVIGCGKILPHNVAMVCHMWSHVVYFNKRPFTSDSNVVNEMKSLQRCSHCLGLFDNPYDCTKHYMEVHRRNITTPSHYICNTCERSEDMSHFTDGHPALELPYECRFCKCRYGCRDALLQHFAKTHINTTRLMCPFCPFVTTLPATDKNRAVVKPRLFVEHMLMHAEYIEKRCSLCACKFLLADLTDTMFEKHRKCHSTALQKLQTCVKNIQELRNSIPASRHRAPMLSLMSCKVCRNVFTSFGEHFGPKSKCKYCQYETECSLQFNKHVALCDRNPKNRERFEFAFNPRSFATVLRGGLDADEQKLTCSPAFIQNFGCVRDFAYDNPVGALLDKPRDFQVDVLTGFAKQPDRYECLRHVIPSRKLNVMRKHEKETYLTILTCIDSPIDENYRNFVKKIRRPFVPYYQYFLDHMDDDLEYEEPFTGDPVRAPVATMEADVEVDQNESASRSSIDDHVPLPRKSSTPVEKPSLGSRRSTRNSVVRV